MYIRYPLRHVAALFLGIGFLKAGQFGVFWILVGAKSCWWGTAGPVQGLCKRIALLRHGPGARNHCSKVPSHFH